MVMEKNVRMDKKRRDDDIKRVRGDMAEEE